jgi:signal transduction histidine kinase/DNA-binding response OmpR family regulator
VIDPAPAPAPPRPRGPAPAGDMAERIRDFDWASSPIGPPDTWSPTLRMMVGVTLANRFPLLLWWGPSFVCIYNDAYSPILGTKHPWALGRPVSETWSEIWHILRPLIETPYLGGPATWMEDLQVEISRHGFFEETHFTIAYSPVPDETAPRGIGGVLATVVETSGKVVAERRVAALRDLGARLSLARTAEDACAIAAKTLAAYDKDIPFALLYLTDGEGKTARLAAATGVPAGADLGLSDAAGWPWREMVSGALVVDRLGERFATVPPGPWVDPPHTAILLPIGSGFLVTGVSARLALDDQYRDFLELVRAQIGTAIANARAYDEERRRAEALAELDRAKTVFFSNVSHEFRTPLTLQLGPLEDVLVDTRQPVSPDHRDKLEIAHRNSLRLLKLVNSLLEFSRIEAGRLEAAYAPIDLAALTTDLASTFRSAIERGGLTLQVDCPPLPEPVYVDRDMWEKVVLNLLSNALKHTFEGEIAVELRATERGAELVVRDTGVGIPAGQLPRLFERFHRVPQSRARTQEGSGIGLALVQELVRLHGGGIAVESREDAGTTFTVTVPFGSSHLPREAVVTGTSDGARDRRADASGGAYVEEALRWLPDSKPAVTHAALDDVGEARPSSGLPAPGARILVADDNADMRGYVTRLLAGQWQVESVSDGLSALRAIAERPPDLVVADIMMPGVDGFELLRRLRADAETREIPVILLSARAGEESRVEGLNAGADDYLVKPFSARELIARVGATLHLARVRREGAEALRESEARFRALVTASSDVVYRMSPDWSEMRYLVGREFIPDMPTPSRSWMDRYIPAEDQPAVRHAIRKAIESRRPYELEHRVLRVDGTVGWTFSRAIPILDENGEIIEWFGAATDVTRLRESEERLRQSAKMEAIGRLAGGVAHDFNNQLQGISGFARFIAKDSGLSAVSRQDLAALQHAADRMAGVTRQLLAFSRQQFLQPETLDLNVAVTDGQSLLQRLIGSSIDIRLDLAAEPLWTRADPAQLLQVLMNLTINARDAMPEGGRLTIRTARRTVDGRRAGPAPGSYVELAVSDTGAGIAPEHLAHVFEPFFTTKQVGEGTGLGLATVHGIVSQSQGHIRVESVFGDGATFVVLLPAAPTPGAPPRRAEPDEERSLHGCVLVVDDEEMVRSILARTLREESYEVLEAANGREALECLAREGGRVDLVVSDVVMPVLGGRELRARLANEYPEVPVVWISGYPHESVFHGPALPEGAPFLQKPIDLQVLTATVRSVLARAERGVSHR